jgi:hypothetical protein
MFDVHIKHSKYEFQAQSSSRILKLAGRGSGEIRKERDRRGTKIVAALWQEISANNTSPKYIGRCNLRAGIVTLM